MWYSSFWSEGPKNPRNLKILDSKFVPRGFEAQQTWGFKYSCPNLVRPKSEELISRPFVGEIQFQLVLLKRMGTESAIGCLIFYPPGTFFLPHTCTQHPRGHGRFQKDLFRSRSIGFVWWEIHSTCFWTNPSGNAHVLADAVCMCGAKQKYLVDEKKSSLLQTRCPCASVALIGTEFHPQTAEK